MSRRTVIAAATSLCLVLPACSRPDDGTLTFREATPDELQAALTGAATPASAPVVATTAAPGVTFAAAAPPVAPTPTLAPATVPPSTPASSSTSAPSTSTSSSTSTSTSTTSADSDECLDTLSVRERVALLVWPAVYTSDWSAAVVAARDLGVGGVLLMKPNDGVDESELADLIGQLDTASSLGVLVSTDEEGGNVQRLRAYERLASQAEVAATLDPDDAAQLIAGHGEMVARVGVDVVLGPVVDVLASNGESALDSTRFFSDDPEAVAEYAMAYVSGWNTVGLLPVLKHFPGHGSATADTHDAAAQTPPLDELELRDLMPYRSVAAQAPEVAVMMGHLTVPGLTNGLPASLSPTAVSYLRDEIGYEDALVITDALEMDAVSLSVPEAAVAAVGAGVDVVIFSKISSAEQVVAALESAVENGTLPVSRVNDASSRVLGQLEDRGGGCDG